jgi:hypothetical protein
VRLNDDSKVAIQHYRQAAGKAVPNTVHVYCGKLVCNLMLCDVIHASEGMECVRHQCHQELMHAIRN